VTNNDSKSMVRNVSDTARWVACFRAQETLRADRVFADPFAERLAGERGFEIARTLPDGEKHEWAWVARTYLFDQFVAREVSKGAELVVNLAAGLDARPYRMELPETLQWVEVDFPEVIAYKEDILRDEKPKCELERFAVDLSNESDRRRLFDDLDMRKRRTAVVSEGLLIYFAPEEVITLAKDLFDRKNFGSWIIDLASQGQLRLMQQTTGKTLSEAGAAFKFGPAEGPNFFGPAGWNTQDVQGLLKTAAMLKRAPKELLSLLPEPANRYGMYPWTGVCLLERTQAGPGR